MLQISSPNIAETLATLEAADVAMPGAATEARKAIGELTYERDMQYLQEIYDQPDTEDYVNGDYLGHYLGGSRQLRSGALKTAETLIQNANETLITTKPGLVSGPLGTKQPENYVEIRSDDSRPAGAFWRDRASADAENEGMEKGEIAFVEAMPPGLVSA